ncbi:NAD(P)/FAD-dependent oxidoreductase [Paraglaciecola chathamensis]|jgi:NADH dehydrogenase|uniref:NAD(P)/FAD-dependent oxidoreductase n=3 Tax=Paraglaciecola chathamensis TaxID=368405 RepID=A0A8H9IDH6_9ALTE|nr:MULTISPECIES: NAD(P)/FAD-dependent oxidoreductase [Paraglaciecola]AEE25146.1 FAD-dependent pyridine nucleotide-disulfide oxidoreductase [Glaciecola sp. 4H-3-7+YE-5]MBN27704.1 NAD(P)/FAD-dependent oxidoreductase [Alteromonadaceae bacterium]MBJ2136672.1 NAD(P)/FAD-dependent oxidoreductase [Paraglaciecola chathamensis]MDO6561122.1 NAD(P)/FAD-dependent oxidoreductase [Paraglaciecola chathamensis]MDO6840271.1 NAD(P)/FAD-dependent oxidoreductase [Paraglaciecola chathamensis]|tara:strand:+ start:38015 stop:39307 length:1293 start_codon:yes stop_codon:yes gene_type:complete
MKRIVVVGGGAGGLELVAQLSRYCRKHAAVELILVDKVRTHVWKPLLHEVAAGIIDKNSDGVDYRIHASRLKYEFQQGTLKGLDEQNKTIALDALYDEEGELILPERTIEYDILVLAIGSVSNDFGTPGVKENSYFLDSLAQAERFHRALLNQMLRVNQPKTQQSLLKVAIVGAGATGTELAAQLHHVANLSRAYGMPAMSAQRLEISIIEAGPRILPALPERIAYAAKGALQKIGVKLYEDTKVTRAEKNGFVTAGDELIEADLMVWAAGVKAPNLIKELDMFETNRAQQVLVDPQLRAKNHQDIYVLGDCCAFQQEDGTWVPPRAQSAHQMASTVYKNIVNQLQGKEFEDYKYSDYGSLVHLSKYSTVGSLMGNLSNSSMFVEGKLARLVYTSLYSMHQFAVHGWLKATLTMLSRRVSKFVGPKLKLH